MAVSFEFMLSDNMSLPLIFLSKVKEKKAVLLHNNTLSNDTGVKDKAMQYHFCKLRENRKALFYHLSAISYV